MIHINFNVRIILIHIRILAHLYLPNHLNQNHYYDERSLRLEAIGRLKKRLIENEREGGGGKVVRGEVPLQAGGKRAMGRVGEVGARRVPNRYETEKGARARREWSLKISKLIVAIPV